jgi:hypothetical protein
MSSEPVNSPGFSRARRLTIALSVAAGVLAALAVVAMANYLAGRHFIRWQWTGQNAMSLSPMTLKVLQSLTNQVKVVVFFDADEPMYNSVVALLKEYQAACPRIELQKVDYLWQPQLAQSIRDKYRLTFPMAGSDVLFKNLVVFDANGQLPRVIYQQELSDYDPSGLISGKSKEIKRTSFKGEMLFTREILSLVDPRPLKAAFLTGHREHNPASEEVGGYAKFAGLLRQKNVQVDPLSLLGTNQVPADCQLLVIAGPRDRLSPAELEKVDQYLKTGGRLLALLRPPTEVPVRTGLETVLAPWGVEVGDNVLFDEPNTVTKLDLIATNFSAIHPIMKPIFESRLYFGLPRSVGKRANIKPDADAPKVEELVLTGSQAMAITDIRDGVPYMNPREARRPMPFMVAVEKGYLPGVSSDRGATRMVVAGESHFLSNQGIDSTVANRDFANLAIGWLLDRPSLMGGIGPRPVREYRLNLTRAQMVVINSVLLAGLPGTLLLLGGLVWLRRRH